MPPIPHKVQPRDFYAKNGGDEHIFQSLSARHCAKFLTCFIWFNSLTALEMGIILSQNMGAFLAELVKVI